MALNSGDSRPGSREPVTCSSRSASHDDTLVGSTPGGINDKNETKVKQALGKARGIKRGAPDHEFLPPRKRLRTRQASFRSGVNPASIAKQPETVRSQKTSALSIQEEDDIQEAIARSLRDISARPPPPQTQKHRAMDDLDMTEIEPTAFTPNRQPPKRAGKARSYRTIGSSSASSATASHETLHGLLNNMDAAVKALSACAPDGAGLDAQELIDHIRKWQGTVSKAIYASESAERQRTKDLQAQLDFDRDVERAHQNDMDRLNQRWRAKMRAQEQEWHKKMTQVQQGIVTRQQPGGASQADRAL